MDRYAGRGGRPVGMMRESAFDADPAKAGPSAIREGLITRRPLVYADRHNADAGGRLRLNSIGTIRDLSRQNITPRDGLRLTLHDEELGVDGEVCFSPREHLWAAAIDLSLSMPRTGVSNRRPKGTGPTRSVSGFASPDSIGRAVRLSRATE
jgi:hypothetical protein